MTHVTLGDPNEKPVHSCLGKPWKAVVVCQEAQQGWQNTIFQLRCGGGVAVLANGGVELHNRLRCQGVCIERKKTNLGVPEKPYMMQMQQNVSIPASLGPFSVTFC